MNNISYTRLILKTIIPIAVLFAALQIYGYLKSSKPKIASKEGVEKVWPVRAAKISYQDHQPHIKLYGEVIAGRQVDLRALVTGKIINVSENFRSGGIVKKDEILLQIDGFEYQGALTDAKAKLSEAKAKLAEILAALEFEKNALEFEQEQLEIGRRDLQRAEALAKDGTVTKRALDERRLLVVQRTQNIVKRKNGYDVQLAKSGQQRAIIVRWEWSVRQAKRNLKDTKLVAPFEAYVSGVTAQVGRIVSANDNVATLFDKNWTDVKFTLSDAQYGRILASDENMIDREVAVNWRVGASPLVYKARVERVNPQITSDSGGVQLFARILQHEQIAPVKSGAFVEIIFPDRKYTNVARLPQTSLFERNFVYIIEDDRLLKRQVEVVGTAQNDILVQGDLPEGHFVLLTRLSIVGEGVKVKITNQLQLNAPNILSKTSYSEKE
ncbi:MAG: HlyD family efflux transporter periplasmic adaptor subunit [Pseudomonadota bacterium]